MNLCYITFRSVTWAQRGEKMLSSARIRCSLQRTPRWMEEQGCGYALKLWTDSIASAAGLLREHKIQLRRIYVQPEDGQLEEVSL